MELRGQIECPICGVASPHHHDPMEVELERYARPAFEEYARTRVRHMGKETYGEIAVHYGAALFFNKRDGMDRYYENSVEAAWQAFAAAWMASDATTRRAICGKAESLTVEHGWSANFVCHRAANHSGKCGDFRSP